MSENNEALTITANALVKKRADMLFEIAAHEKALDRLRADLIHLDAVLRLLRPEFDAADLPVRQRRPTKSPYFAHGEMTQRIYDMLREHGMVGAADVATQAMRDKGLDPVSDKATRTDFVRRVGIQLADMARKGKVERIGKGPALRWQLKS